MFSCLVLLWVFRLLVNRLQLQVLWNVMLGCLFVVQRLCVIMLEKMFRLLVLQVIMVGLFVVLLFVWMWCSWLWFVVSSFSGQFLCRLFLWVSGKWVRLLSVCRLFGCMFRVLNLVWQVGMCLYCCVIMICSCVSCSVWSWGRGRVLCLG